MKEFKFFNIEFNILLTNEDDAIRLLQLIDSSCRSNVGETKILKSEINEIRNILIK